MEKARVLPSNTRTPWESFFYQFSKDATDLATDEIPYVAQAKAADKLINNRNLVTGEEELGALDRYSSALEFIPGGSVVKKVTKGWGMVFDGVKKVGGGALGSLSKHFRRTAKNADRVVDTASDVQRTMRAADAQADNLLESMEDALEAATKKSAKTAKHAQPVRVGIDAPKSAGRAGKQARLRELADDPNVPKADRGWIKQEINQIERGKRKNIRLPGSSNKRVIDGKKYGGNGGKELAHRRGFEARKGFGYEHSDLQDKVLHKLQHKHEGYK